MANINCYAVLVTYDSDTDILVKTIRSLAPQIQGLVVVDNSQQQKSILLESFIQSELDLSGIDYNFLKNGGNIGIAAAQNIGINYALGLGADFIIFSDHDTIFPENTVKILLNNYELKISNGEKVGAIGPAYLNSNTTEAKPFFIVHRGFRSERVYPNGKTIEVSYLIASGLLVSAESIKIIGGFKEELFIDWVDIEWCLRAKSLGFRIYGCDEVCLLHRLGDHSVEVFGRQITIHSPFRHYYMIRNSVWLFRLNYIGPLVFRCRFLYTALVYVLVFPIISKPHLKHFKACWLGLFHGFGRMRK